MSHFAFSRRPSRCMVMVLSMVSHQVFGGTTKIPAKKGHGHSILPVHAPSIKSERWHCQGCLQRRAMLLQET
jgi:hypothetical protein